MTHLASILFALLVAIVLTLATCTTAHASGAPVPDVLIDLLLTPGGWIVLGAAVVAIVALIVRASRHD